MALPLHAELKRRRVFRALVGYGIAAPLSIAVLPLADMSPGKDQEYFSDGVAEEISAGYERAMAAAEKAVELEPGQVWSHAGAFQIAETYAWFGDRGVAVGIAVSAAVGVAVAAIVVTVRWVGGNWLLW